MTKAAANARFIRIKGAKSVDGSEVTLTFVDKLSRERDITLPRDLAFELTLVIRQALARPPVGVSDLRQSVVYELAGCQKLASEGMQGLVLVTREGFQIPLSYGESERADLRHAIDEADPVGISTKQH